MSIDSATPRFSRKELVQSAVDAGHANTTKRLVTDWAAIGLLDLGTERGRGRGKGKVYLWSENQRRLFLVLLDKHGTVARPTLLNIPISLWLIWGDGYVPLRQARRALASWAGANRRSGVGRAQRTARRVAAELDHLGADRQARERLRELVAGAAYGNPVQHEELLAAARDVFDPHRSRPTAPPTAITPEAYVRTLEARLVAVRRLENERGENPIPDDAFLSARQMYLTTGPTARAAAAPLSRDEQLLTPELVGVDVAINSACVHLLTLVGFALASPNGLPVGRHPSGSPPTRHGLRR